MAAPNSVPKFLLNLGAGFHLGAGTFPNAQNFFSVFTATAPWPGSPRLGISRYKGPISFQAH